jgi:branched-chain amino acid transport system permease protein
LIAALAIAFLIPLAVHKPYYLHVLTICLFWAYMAASWNIIGGFVGQLSLGHGIYTAIGAYGTVILFNNFHISPWIGMILAGIVATGIAVLIGLPTFKLRGAYFALSTVALSAGLVVLIENTEKIGNILIGGAEGLSVNMAGSSFLNFQFMSKVPYYYIALVMLILVVLFSRQLMKSKLGYYMIAVREDEDAARALGINVRTIKLKSIALSAFATALGGAFYAMLIRYLLPSAIAGADMSNQMVFLTIVGGSGSVLGPVIGGISLSLISEVVRFFLGDKIMGLHLLIYGLVVVLIIMYKPRGIIEVLEKWYTRWFKRTPEQEEV